MSPARSSQHPSAADAHLRTLTRDFGSRLLDAARGSAGPRALPKTSMPPEGSSSGTLYTAAYSGRPVVGIPMQPEQQYNIDILVRHGSAIRLSRRHFREEALLGAIETILGDYERYRARAEALARRLPVIDGAQRGAERIKAIAIEHLGDEKTHLRVG